MPSVARLETDPPEVAALKERLRGFETEEGRMRGLRMRTRASDVFVATSSKSGTTWMQMIVHQLRSGGDMSFDEISLVVPWVELSTDLGLDIDAEQAFEPRAFKTHLWCAHTPRRRPAKERALECGGNGAGRARRRPAAARRAL